MSLRTPKEQVEGLMEVIERATKLHRINLVIFDPEKLGNEQSQLALTGVEHGRDVEILYLIGGYDVWIRDPESFGGESMAESDLTADEAAQVIADAYMHDKAATVLDRFGWSTGAIEHFLEDDERREWLFAELDKGSDKARTSEQRKQRLRQGLEAMVKQTGQLPTVLFTDE